jgi:hypothetical protein
MRLPSPPPDQSSLLSALEAVWSREWSRAWAVIQGTGAAFMSVMYFMNDVFQNQNFSALLAGLHVPGWVPVSVAVLGLVTFIAQHKSE